MTASDEIKVESRLKIELQLRGQGSGAVDNKPRPLTAPSSRMTACSLRGYPAVCHQHQKPHPPVELLLVTKAPFSHFCINMTPSDSTSSHRAAHIGPIAT